MDAVARSSTTTFGIVFDTVDVQGERRAPCEAGTTDEVRWFDLQELANLPHVELVDFDVDLLAQRSNRSIPAAIRDQERRSASSARLINPITSAVERTSP